MNFSSFLGNFSEKNRIALIQGVFFVSIVITLPWHHSINIIPNRENGRLNLQPKNLLAIFRFELEISPSQFSALSHRRAIILWIITQYYGGKQIYKIINRNGFFAFTNMIKKYGIPVEGNSKRNNLDFFRSELIYSIRKYERTIKKVTNSSKWVESY